MMQAPVCSAAQQSKRFLFITTGSAVYACRVSDRYFCTSYIFAAYMVSTGVSCPSIAFDSRAG